MTNDRRIAADLRRFFGVEAGTRLAIADVARTIHQNSVYSNRAGAREAAFEIMWEFEAGGLVDDSPGPRGGAGWSLSTKGAALIARSRSNSEAERAR